MKKLLLGIGMLFSVLLAMSVMADSWLPPSVRSYSSANGTWKLTIYPRGLTSQLGYFEDKVAGKTNAGGIPGDSQKSPIGHMERKQAGRWQSVWKGPLANDVAPVEAVVSNDGISVTFDNWHGVGWGDDAVVIYDAGGGQVRKLGLAAFLPKYYIDALPRSVSSIHWRGMPRIDEAKQELVIPIVVPTAEEQDAHTERTRHVDVRLLLSDGSLMPMAGEAWVEASESATKASARRRQLLEEERKRFISPLAAPRDGDIAAWHGYLRDAYFRLDPDWENGYPVTEVVPLPSDPKFGLLARYLGDALSDDMNADDVVMVASPSQDMLVTALLKQAKRAKPGFLAKARVYVAADNAHMPSIRTALAHTGAKVIQLDIDTEIPQRKERLEAYLRNSEDNVE
ncbi:MAG: hypothetical protein ACREO7_09560 [Pseudoxanthomonas sp.]